MAAPTIRILPPTAPLVDTKTGNIRDTWWRYFNSQYRDVNAVTSGSVTTAVGSGLQGGGNPADGISLSIAPNGVTNAMIREGLATSVIGRAFNSVGNVADIQAVADDTIFGRFGGQLMFAPITAVPAVVADGDYGDITVSGVGTVWTIDSGVVTNAKLATQAQTTIKGRAAAAGTGVVTDLTAGQVWTILATTTQAITTSGLTQATARLLGRTTASTGAVEEITVGNGLSLASGALGIANPATTPGDFDVTGLSRCNSFRIDQSPTAEVIVCTHTITINVSGTDYKIPIVAA